jgi:hypothetical protein
VINTIVIGADTQKKKEINDFQKYVVPHKHKYELHSPKNLHNVNRMVIPKVTTIQQQFLMKIKSIMFSSVVKWV